MSRSDVNLANGLLTVKDVAARLRVPPSWVYSHSGELGVFHLGKYLRFSWARTLEYLEKGGADLSEVGSASAVGRVVKPPTQRPSNDPTIPNQKVQMATLDDRGTT